MFSAGIQKIIFYEENNELIARVSEAGSYSYFKGEKAKTLKKLKNEALKKDWNVSDYIEYMCSIDGKNIFNLKRNIYDDIGIH